MRLDPWVFLGLALVLATAGAACVAPGREDESPGWLVDDKRGAYGGVKMGDSEQDVRRLFGKPSSEPGFAPAGRLPSDVGVPQSIPGPGRLLRYEEVGFLVGGAGVYAFIVAADSAKTTRGVAIGEGMDEARRAYRLSCMNVAGGERVFGGQEFYPSCSKRLGKGLRIWFGRDPIESITLVSGRHT